jgi:hypothetical protein
VNLTFCKPDVLKPDVLKPNVLKPDVLKPDVLWVYRDSNVNFHIISVKGPTDRDNHKKEDDKDSINDRGKDRENCGRGSFQ